MEKKGTNILEHLHVPESELRTPYKLYFIWSYNEISEVYTILILILRML